MATAADLSQLYAVLSSGYNCASLAGPTKTVAEYTVVGGSGRFEGASGTVSVVTDGVALSPAPGTSAFSATVQGELTVGSLDLHALALEGHVDPLGHRHRLSSDT